MQILILKVRPLTRMIVTLCLKVTAAMTVHMTTCCHSLIHQKVSVMQFLNNFISCYTFSFIKRHFCQARFSLKLLRNTIHSTSPEKNTIGSIVCWNLSLNFMYWRAERTVHNKSWRQRDESPADNIKHWGHHVIK